MWGHDRQNPLATSARIRWPGVIKPGTKSRGLISAEVVGPTLLEAAGLQPDQGMAGVIRHAQRAALDMAPSRNKTQFVRLRPWGPAAMTKDTLAWNATTSLGDLR
jgi:arylsulfatase A-like enzyme